MGRVNLLTDIIGLKLKMELTLFSASLNELSLIFKFWFHWPPDLYILIFSVVLIFLLLQKSKTILIFAIEISVIWRFIYKQVVKPTIIKINISAIHVN